MIREKEVELFLSTFEGKEAKVTAVTVEKWCTNLGGKESTSTALEKVSRCNRIRLSSASEKVSDTNSAENDGGKVGIFTIKKYGAEKK